MEDDVGRDGPAQGIGALHAMLSENGSDVYKSEFVAPAGQKDLLGNLCGQEGEAPADPWLIENLAPAHAVRQEPRPTDTADSQTGQPWFVAGILAHGAVALGAASRGVAAELH
ncbi:MAG: hypothetical protein DWH91_16785 [Planctomycetota bacterium]|nr:MAG: hypothetical protein DWH91_16785 [Planctomycetota bacterium]